MSVNEPKIDGIYCRQCGYQITIGYSYKGYCAVCAETIIGCESNEEFLKDLKKACEREY